MATDIALLRTICREQMGGDQARDLRVQSIGRFHDIHDTRVCGKICCNVLLAALNQPVAFSVAQLLREAHIGNMHPAGNDFLGEQ